MLQLALLILIFIILSGILAMIDAALLSVTKAEVEVMVHKKLLGALPLQIITNNITRAVVVIVILTNTINVLGPILVGKRALELYGDPIIGIITAVLTFGTILFSEIIPKSIGSHRAPVISRTVAPCILTLIYIFYPIVWMLEKVVNYVQSGSSRKVGTEDQIRSLVRLGSNAGHIAKKENQIIERAFLLNDNTARDAMTPLEDIRNVWKSDTIKKAAMLVFHETYSRYPVFGKSINDVEGMIIGRDVLQVLSEGHDDLSVESIVRPCLTVEDTTKADALLELFRREQTHLAVVQQHGKTVGLVTLEDVLEELVGEIEDERGEK